MCARAKRRNSGFQSSRPLDYVYDREWTLPPDVFAQDASKAVRALSTVVVRPDFRTMFSNRARHSVSVIPDRAAPYGMRAYRRLQWMKMASRSSQVDVQGRDSHRFRARSCPRAVTDMQESQVHVSPAARSNRRAVPRSPPAPIRHRSGKDQPRTVVITESHLSTSEEDDEDDEDEPPSGRHSPERVRLVDAEEEDSSEDSWVGEGSTPNKPRLNDKSNRIRGLSSSEETLIMLNRHERHIVREAWEASLPMVDQNQADWDRRAALELELEKDMWNLRSKEIEAINRARFLTDERDRNRKLALLKSFHTFWMTTYHNKTAKKLTGRLQLVRRNHQRAMRKLQAEWCGVENRRPKKDPVWFLVDPSYDGFSPQKRFGEQAKRWHEYLPNRGKLFEDSKVVRELEKCVSGNWKPSKFEFLPPKEWESPELCVYLTKWTPAKLKTLHADLKEKRNMSNRARRRFKPREWAQHTETTENVNDFRPRFVPPQELKVTNAVLTLQKILRGRAVQSIMYKGRRHNRELIREILSSKPFDTGEEEPDVATRGLMASTGWPRLKTYDEYSQKPLQEKWVQQVLSSLPPTVDVYNLMDFVNMNLMKMRGHHDKSGENTETLPTPGPASSKASKTSLGEAEYISCGISRPSNKKRQKPGRRPPCERRILEEDEMNRILARVRPRHPRQGSAPRPEEAERPDVPSEMDVYLARVETIQESRTMVQSGLNSTAASAVTCLAARPSTAESTIQGELRRNLSQRSTVEIHGRSSSHVGFRSGPWASRSPPNECPSTPASIDTVTAISRFTGDDFTDRRLDEEEFPSSFRPRPSAGINVSASASEDTPSSDDTHIITDDATEIVAAAFRAKVREQGNTLAAQRIDEAPSPTDSGNGSMIAIPILGRSVSEQRAPAALVYSASEEQTRIVATPNSETTITTDTSELSWTRNEARQISISRNTHDKNRNLDVHLCIKVKDTIGGPGTNGKPNVEMDEDDLPKKVD